MRELLRTNNLIAISRIKSLLDDAGIENHVFDTHSSSFYGNAIEQRIMVRKEDYPTAQEILKGVEL